MVRFQLVAIAIFVATACGGSQSAGPATRADPAGEPSPQREQEQASGEPARDDEFQIQSSEDASLAHGERPSQIEATATHAAMRLFVVNRDSGPIEGIVIKMTGPDGAVYYTRETDSHGYAEVLVPVARRYEVEYLTLGRRNITASVEVAEGRNQDIRLTMRYRRIEEEPRFVLEGVLFETNRAIIQDDSFPRLDRVVEYMRYRTSSRIRVEGHTDNVGNPRRNRTLSEMRARAVRDYLAAHGIDASRIEAVGHGHDRPVATNDSEEGRAQNRRIEAIEL